MTKLPPEHVRELLDAYDNGSFSASTNSQIAMCNLSKDLARQYLAACELVGALRKLKRFEENSGPFGGEIARDRHEQLILNIDEALAKWEVGDE